MRTPEMEKKGQEKSAPSPARGQQTPNYRERLRKDLMPLGYQEQTALLSPKAGALGQASVQAQSVGAEGIEFLLAWNSNADLTKVLAFSTPGITAFGVALLAEAAGGKDELRGYPNLTADQWRWIRDTGHPFAVGNYWEQNSQGKPLVFTNIYGHGTLGIINMTVADALFPNSPLLALVAASIMYTNFELFGEGSIRAPYEPNDFFISNVIPMLGSQAVADLLHLNQKIPMGVVASAQALVYALCSGKKMTKEDWLSLAAYPVLVRLVELSPLFRGKNRILDAAFEHVSTIFGMSREMGPYTGIAVRGEVGSASVTGGVAIGPGGQRFSVGVTGEAGSADAYVERTYRPEGGTDWRVGASVTVPLGRPAKDETAVLRDAVIRDIKGYVGAMKGRAPDRETIKALDAVERDLLDHAKRCRTRERLEELRSGLHRGAVVFSSARTREQFQGAAALLRSLIRTGE